MGAAPLGSAAEYRSWWKSKTDVPYGLCWCGCGRKTKLAKRTSRDRGWIEGEPIRFINGHQSRSTTPIQEDEICRRYLAGEKLAHISEDFGVDPVTIHRILRRHQVPEVDKDDPSRSLTPTEYRRWWKRQRSEIPYGSCWCGCGEKTDAAPYTDYTKNWLKGQPKRYLPGHLNASRAAWASESEKDEICRRYLEGEGSYALAKEFGVSGPNLGKMLNQRGIKRRSASETHRTNSADHSFFNTIDTEEKAYWLGVMAADGNIVTGKPILKLAFASRDRGHLLKFRSALQSTHAVTDYITKTGYYGAKVSIASPELAQALANHGVIPSKTFVLKWPDHLESELLRHFLRGYFDGDGSFKVRPTKTGSVALRWEIIGNEEFCLGAQEYLMKALGVRKTKLARPPNSPDIRRLNYMGRNQVRRICHLMYEGATIWLPRKREVIQPYVRPLSESMPVMSDGGKLRALRKEQGMTVEELAAKAGASPRTVSELENGKRSPVRFDTIRRHAEALEIDPKELTRDEG